MLVKIHRSYRLVVGICDKELLGRKFEEGRKVLEVSENFYNGEEMNEEEVSAKMADLAKEDATFNIVGEKSISLALDCGIISSDGVKKIRGIPFALVLL
jgi:hypothetical protein